MSGWFDDDEEQGSTLHEGKENAERNFVRMNDKKGMGKQLKESEEPVFQQKSIRRIPAPKSAPSVSKEMVEKLRTSQEGKKSHSSRDSREGRNMVASSWENDCPTRRHNDSVSEEDEFEREPAVLRSSLEKEKERKEVEQKLQRYNDDHYESDEEDFEENEDVIKHPGVSMSKFRLKSIGDESDDNEGGEIDDDSDNDSDNAGNERILSEEDVNRFASGASTPKLGSPKHSFSIIAHESGRMTDRVHCTLLRDRYKSRFYPEYQLVFDDSKKTILLARKMTMNTTSNYHIFDMSRGMVNLKAMDKRSGNYLGKLRACAMEGSDYVLVTRNEAQKEEVAAISYERPGFMDQLKDGSQPRRMMVAVPHTDEENLSIPNTVDPTSGHPSLSEYSTAAKKATGKGVHLLHSKEPSYENGNYRLNFFGRVSLASVKNFQLVSDKDPEDVVVQFGKVGEDKFHLDFKAPVTAFQAFSFALTQFNM